MNQPYPNRQPLPPWQAGLGLLLVLVFVRPGLAQHKLLEGRPFDQVILNDESEVEIFPLDFPGRQMPSSRPAGNLTVRLVNRPGQTYDLSWGDISSIKFFEQLLLEEAASLTDESNFDAAFGYYDRLTQDYPDYPGLNEALSHYLKSNALALYQEQEYDRALAVLISLHDHHPQHVDLQATIDTVAGKVIEQRLKKQDFSGARAVLDLLSTNMPRAASSTINTWQARFEKAAQRKLLQAERDFEQGQYTAAQRAARRAHTIWPKLEKIGELLEHIQTQHPQIIVGVLESAPPSSEFRLDSWPAQRVVPLLHHSIVELRDYNSEGGVYESPFGQLQLDQTGRQLSLHFHTSAQLETDVSSVIAGHELARYLLAMADPSHVSFSSTFANLCEGVSVDEQGTVRIDFRQPLVRPEALFRHILAPDVWSESPPPTQDSRAVFTLQERSPDFARFERTGAKSTMGQGELKAIVEQAMPDDNTAIAALVRGDVTILDRVPPWGVARLKSVKDITVGNYRLPTVHALVPNLQNKLLQRREFRRALCYGIARQRIVKQVITAGKELPGYEVLSGPLPPGRSLSDPLRYGYNSQVKPRPYEPRLAATLALVAADSVARSQNKPDSQNKPNKKNNNVQEDPAASSETEHVSPEADGEIVIPPLVLAHSSDALTRTACDLIQQQLGQIGITIKLAEVDQEALLTDSSDYDLRYVELTIAEPLIDVHALVGRAATANPGSPSMRSALRDLDSASTWRHVREQLGEFHRIAHNDLPLIPLWQTTNHFAYRTELEGIGDDLIHLYQNVADWRLVPAQPQR
jgi:tetratricopeptide (TPR) repeat protein